MKKSILNLGKALSKSNQKKINGGMIGGLIPCYRGSDFVCCLPENCGMYGGRKNNHPGPGRPVCYCF